MRGNVAAASRGRVAPQCMGAAQQPSLQARPAALQAVEQIPVAHQDAHQRHQIIAAPVACHVRFSRPHAAARRHGPIEGRIDDLHAGAQVGRPGPQVHGAGGILDEDASRAEPAQLRDHALAQKAVAGAEARGGGAKAARRRLPAFSPVVRRWGHR